MTLRDEEREPEFCRNCGQTVLMMCRLMTGFCSEKCEEDYAERGCCRGDGGPCPCGSGKEPGRGGCQECR